MASKLISLDRESLQGAVAGRSVFLGGLLVYVVLVGIFIIPEFGDSIKEQKAMIGFGFQTVGALTLLIAASKSKEALRLSSFGIAAGAILSFFIPCLFLVMVLSLWIRLDKYFTTWQMYLQQPSPWSAKQFLASEAGQNWQTVTLDPANPFRSVPAAPGSDGVEYPRGPNP